MAPSRYQPQQLRKAIDMAVPVKGGILDVFARCRWVEEKLLPKSFHDILQAALETVRATANRVATSGIPHDKRPAAIREALDQEEDWLNFVKMLSNRQSHGGSRVFTKEMLGRLLSGCVTRMPKRRDDLLWHLARELVTERAQQLKKLKKQRASAAAAPAAPAPAPPASPCAADALNNTVGTAPLAAAPAAPASAPAALPAAAPPAAAQASPPPSPQAKRAHATNTHTNATTNTNTNTVGGSPGTATPSPTKAKRPHAHLTISTPPPTNDNVPAATTPSPKAKRPRTDVPSAPPATAAAPAPATVAAPAPATAVAPAPAPTSAPAPATSSPTSSQNDALYDFLGLNDDHDSKSPRSGNTAAPPAAPPPPATAAAPPPPTTRLRAAAEAQHDRAVQEQRHSVEYPTPLASLGLSSKAAVTVAQALQLLARIKEAEQDGKKMEDYSVARIDEIVVGRQGATRLDVKHAVKAFHPDTIQQQLGEGWAPSGPGGEMLQRVVAEACQAAVQLHQWSAALADDKMQEHKQLPQRRSQEQQRPQEQQQKRQEQRERGGSYHHHYDDRKDGRKDGGMRSHHHYDDRKDGSRRDQYRSRRD